MLLYPLSLLHADGKMKKKLDRQRLLTVGYYNLYRYAMRYKLIGVILYGCYFGNHSPQSRSLCTYIRSIS